MTRSIPFSIKLSNLFGGFLNQFGWLFFGFGMIFVWAFGSNADLSFIHFHGEVVTVQGTAVGAAETSTYINEEMVLETFYKFTDQQGDEWEGSSFAAGSYYNAGDPVTIEYPLGRPYLSRIKGMRSSIMGPWILLITIFPAIGLVFVFFGIRLGLKNNYILKNGIISKGKLISKSRTNTEINDQPVYKLTFEFKDSIGQMQQAVVKTHKTEALEDEAEEALMYLEETPQKAILLDALPKKVKFDYNGDIEAASMGSAIPSLIIPGISILGHGWYFMNVFL